jgi:hypothetical protein
MKKTIQTWTLVPAALLALAGAALAADRASVNRRTGLFEPPLSDLRKAAERGDRAELARAAGRLGPARLAKALADPDRRIVLATLEGIPLVASGVLLLDNILPLLGSTDETIRSRAVRVVSGLLGGNDRDRLTEWEVSSETTRAACQGLALVATNEKERLATRLLAMQGLADAAATCTGSLPPAQLLSSHEPDIRRAAVLALQPEPATNGALLAVAKDSDGRVAAAAGARLCSRQAKNRPLPGQPPLRQLALAQDAAPEDVIEILPCLATSSDPADQSALESLRESGPSAVRDAIKSLKPVAKNPRP